MNRKDLKECVLVVAATDDVTENHRIARMAQKKHIPVNAVDQQEDCSFIFPSYLKHRESRRCFFQCGKQSGAHTVFKRKDQTRFE